MFQWFPVCNLRSHREIAGNPLRGKKKGASRFGGTTCKQPTQHGYLRDLLVAVLTSRSDSFQMTRRVMEIFGSKGNFDLVMKTQEEPIVVLFVHIF